MRSRGKASSYKYFIFLNSSVRGPFWPAYMPPDWSWTRAYTDRLRGRVKVVSSSLVCLPEIDAGGPGPKVCADFQPLTLCLAHAWGICIEMLLHKHMQVESWAFGVDADGLELLTDAGVFHTRECKLCNDGVVVAGEYGLSTVILRAGYNIGTLMAMCGARAPLQATMPLRKDHSVLLLVDLSKNGAQVSCRPGLDR